jgi:hypothetical protein
LPHKAALFEHLRRLCQELFQARFEVLLYDLTSAYIEGEGHNRRLASGPRGAGKDRAADTENLVPTFENPSLKTKHLPLSCPLNCESSVSAKPPSV